MIDALTIARRFEKYAPRSLAVAGDPIGWQLGNPGNPVHRILVTLDVRPEVVTEAIALGCDMIFAHHPAMFVSARNLDLRDPQNAMYAEILRNEITVYAAHTNLDNANPGMNDWLAHALRLNDVHPFVEAGELKDMGRVGNLALPITLVEFVKLVKLELGLKGVRVISANPSRRVQRVAVLGGSGAKVFTDAKLAGADVLVSGDVSYHVGHDILAADMAVIDAGHNIEKIMKPNLAALLETWSDQEQWGVEVVQSALNTDPFTFM